MNNDAAPGISAEGTENKRNLVAQPRKKESHKEQLERLRGQVDALRAQLQQAQRLATVGTMAAMVAHEFNNILTPIVNYAQLARQNPSFATKAIDRAADGGKRATTIANAILGLARGEDSPQPVDVNLAELIEQTLAAMARDPRRDGIELVVQAPQDLLIRTRRVELQQVLLNLLINAKAAVLGKSGLRRIELAAQRDGSDVVIRVADNGVGIPQENLPRIFQPFFSTKKAATNDGQDGSGLGLAICKQIVVSLGGDISVASEIGQGAAFTVRLPAEAPCSAAAAAGEPRQLKYA
jgi:signal transduction histidine kinase